MHGEDCVLDAADALNALPLGDNGCEAKLRTRIEGQFVRVGSLLLEHLAVQ